MRRIHTFILKRLSLIYDVEILTFSGSGFMSCCLSHSYTNMSKVVAHNSESLIEIHSVRKFRKYFLGEKTTTDFGPK